MKIIERLGVYFLILILATFIAGIYGILHDQLSYTLSNEYFTQLRFKQSIIPWAYETPRLGAAYVGVFAAWWMGLLIYSILGLIGFIFKSPKLMTIYLCKSMIVVACVAFSTGLIGLGYGYFQVNEVSITDYTDLIPPNVTAPIQFLRVAYMHSASYIGGVTGLIGGIVYLITCNRKINKTNKN